jgi:hypothetical protein
MVFVLVFVLILLPCCLSPVIEAYVVHPGQSAPQRLSSDRDNYLNASCTPYFVVHDGDVAHDGDVVVVGVERLDKRSFGPDRRVSVVPSRYTVIINGLPSFSLALIPAEDHGKQLFLQAFLFDAVGRKRTSPTEFKIFVSAGTYPP